MDAEKLKISSQIANTNQLEKVKLLFSKFKAVAEDINVLYDTHKNSVNKKTISGLCQKNVSVGSSETGQIDAVPNLNGVAYGNVPRNANYVPYGGAIADLCHKNVTVARSATGQIDAVPNVNGVAYGNVPRNANYVPYGGAIADLCHKNVTVARSATGQIDAVPNVNGVAYGNVPRNANYVPYGGAIADLCHKNVTVARSATGQIDAVPNVNGVAYGNVPRNANYVPYGGAIADLCHKNVTVARSATGQIDAVPNVNGVAYGNVPRNANYVPYGGAIADLCHKNVTVARSATGQIDAVPNVNGVAYGNVPRNANYVPYGGAIADLCHKNVTVARSATGQIDAVPNVNGVAYGNVPRNANYVPYGGAIADLCHKNVTVARSETGQIDAVPNLNGVAYGNVPRNANYVPYGGAIADLCHKNVTVARSATGQIDAVPNLNGIAYGNVPRNANYVPYGGAIADLCHKNVTVARSATGQIDAVPNVNGVAYGNVPRNANYVPYGGAIADLCHKNVTVARSATGQIDAVPNVNGVAYGNVPRNANYVPYGGAIADLCHKNVTVARSATGQIDAVPNVNGVAYGNVPRNANYVPYGGAIADLCHKNVTVARSETGQIDAVPNLNGVAYGNVPRNANYVPYGGAIADLCHKNVTVARSATGQIDAVPNLNGIAYGNVPRNANYVPYGGAIADLCHKNVTVARSATGQIDAVPNVNGVAYGNVPRNANYVPYGGAIADLCHKNVTVARSETGQIDAVPNLNGVAYGNVMEMLNTTPANNRGMSFEFPNQYTLNESRLQLILNKACSNYNLDSSTSKLIESAKISEESIEFNSPHVECELIESSDYATFAFGSTNEAIELDSVNRDMIIQPDNESSYVDVTSLSDVSVEQENSNTSKHLSQAVKPRQGCDNMNMFVATSDEGKAKKYCCVYCLKRFSSLVPHLQRVHKNEADVKKFRDSPPRSKQRRNIIDMLRKRGQFEWNTNAQINGGEFLASRRQNPKFRKPATGYLTCENCFGPLSKTCLTRHWNKCTKNLMKGERSVLELGRAVEGRYHADACEDLRTLVFPKMRDDQYVRIIRFDWLVVAFGNDLCLNYSPHFQQQLIRTSLRKAGKVLYAAKAISSEITDFASLYHVKHCNTVIQAIRTVAHFDPKFKQFKSPGTASTLVTLMNAIGDVVVIENMKLDDSEKERNAERFLKVFQKDVKAKINKIVAVQQSKVRRRRKENIPSTVDINRLARYLDGERDKYFVVLTEKFSYQEWLCLAELTMVSILLFNRRRIGEMQNICVCEFHEREMIADADNSNTVPCEIKQLIKSRMQIRGKLNRTVPVLLKHSHDACIELILLHRKDAGVPDKNECIFGLPSKSKNIKTIDAGASIRTFSNLCGAENPSSLRGTKLRKHMASFCATMDLSDNDVTNVANFMGHDDKIHRDIYRHNTLEREVVQMTTLLEAAQGNRSVTTGANVTEVGAKLGKHLSDETDASSSEESSSDEYCDDEEQTSEKRVNNRAKIVTTKTKGKRVNNPAKVVTSKTNEKRVNNRSKIIATKTSEKRVNNPAKVVTSKTSEKRVNNRSKIIAIKTSDKNKRAEIVITNTSIKRKLPVRNR